MVDAKWAQIRKAFRVPHGLCVDQRGNIRLIDVELHQFFKFTQDGSLRETLISQS
jgi:hypothetical protein